MSVATYGIRDAPSQLIPDIAALRAMLASRLVIKILSKIGKRCRARIPQEIFELLVAAPTFGKILAVGFA